MLSSFLTFQNSPGIDSFGGLAFTEFDDTISGNSIWYSVGFDDFFGHFGWFSEILGNTRWQIQDGCRLPIVTYFLCVMTSLIPVVDPKENISGRTFYPRSVIVIAYNSKKLGED